MKFSKYLNRNSIFSIVLDFCEQFPMVVFVDWNRDDTNTNRMYFSKWILDLNLILIVWLPIIVNGIAFVSLIWIYIEYKSKTFSILIFKFYSSSIKAFENIFTKRNNFINILDISNIFNGFYAGFYSSFMHIVNKNINNIVSSMYACGKVVLVH